jgi:hypothetical protein
VTIIAGFHGSDGILLAADTMYVGGSKIHQPKLFGHFLNPGSSETCTLAFALAGDENLGKMAIEDCVEAVSSIPAKKRTSSKIKKALRTAIKTINDHYVDTRPEAEEREEAEFDLIIGAWLPMAGGLRMFRSSGPALLSVPEHYHCTGVGSYLGDYLMRPVFHPKMSLKETTLLAIQAFAAAKAYDAYCGGDTRFLRIISGGQITNAVPFNIEDTELYVSRFDRIARSLLFTLGDLDLDEAEFSRRLEIGFVHDVHEIRKMWKDGRSPWHQILMQRLAEFRRPEDTEPP